MPIDEEELYQEHILDHYEDPFHRGHLPTATHAHEDNNPLCGDVVRIELQLDEDGKINDCLFHRPGLRDQPGLGLDAAGKNARQNGRRRQAVLRRRHAQAVRRPADPEPPEVLPALLEGAAIGGALAGRTE